jgi:hypothetical protein
LNIYDLIASRALFLLPFPRDEETEVKEVLQDPIISEQG